MHRSRLAAIGIDCPASTHDATVAFWSSALGSVGGSDEFDAPFTTVGRPGGHELFVQLIDGEARVHLDIETDDVEAEVARLEQLGALRVRREQSWWIMRDPSGQPFCVVPPQSPDFPDGAAEWADTD